MQKKVRFLGLDVHAETIAVAVAEADGSAQPGSDPEPRRVDTQAGEKAGASGASAGLLRGWSDGVRAVLAADGVRGGVRVIAPTLVPVKAGDR